MMTPLRIACTQALRASTSAPSTAGEYSWGISVNVNVNINVSFVDPSQQGLFTINRLNGMGPNLVADRAPFDARRACVHFTQRIKISVKYTNWWLHLLTKEGDHFDVPTRFPLTVE